MLYIDVAAAHTRARKHNATFTSRSFYSYAASLLKELRNMHGTAYKRRPSSSDVFLLTESPQTETPSLPVKKMYLNTRSLFFYDPTDNKETLAACVEARVQRVVSAVKKHFRLSEEVTTPARVAGRNPPPSTSKDSLQLGKHASMQPTRHDLGVVFRTPPHRERLPSHLQKRYESINPVLGSRIAKEKKLPRSRRGGGKCEKSACSPKTPSTIELTPTKGQMLKHERFADSVPQSRSSRYESSRYSGCLVVPAAFKRDHSLPRAL